MEARVRPEQRYMPMSVLPKLGVVRAEEVFKGKSCPTLSDRCATLKCKEEPRRFGCHVCEAGTAKHHEKAATGTRSIRWREQEYQHIKTSRVSGVRDSHAVGAFSALPLGNIPLVMSCERCDGRPLCAGQGIGQEFRRLYGSRSFLGEANRGAPWYG